MGAWVWCHACMHGYGIEQRHRLYACRHSADIRRHVSLQVPLLWQTAVRDSHLAWVLLCCQVVGLERLVQAKDASIRDLQQQLRHARDGLVAATSNSISAAVGNTQVSV